MSDLSLLAPALTAAVEAGAWVVTASQSSAHRFRLLYANHSVEQGRTAWVTPSIHSFNTFATLLWRAHGNSDQRVLTAQQSKLAWERVVTGSDWSSVLLSPQLAASGAFRSWERLQHWQIRREELEAYASQNEEARALLDWSDRFQVMCRKNAWLPEAVIPGRLLTLERIEHPRHVVLMPSAWQPLPLAVFDHLASLGVQIDRHVQPQTPAKTTVVAADSAELELQAAAEWARQQILDGARSVAVAVPRLLEREALVRRIFAELFAQSTRTLASGSAAGSDRQQQGSRFSVATVQRLADFPIVRSALDLLHCVGGRASGVLVGAVLRSPFLAGSAAEASARAIADKMLRDVKREHYDVPAIERLAASADCTILNTSLRRVRELRVGAHARSTPSVVAEQIIGLWNAFGWPGDAVLDSDEAQIVARLQLCLGEFGALDELLGPLATAAAIREFELWVRNTNFNPRGAPSPITIVDVDAADDQQYEALWIAGMNESEWPPPPSPDPFIPMQLQLRKQMPLATARSVRLHARARFDRFRQSARNVVFSWAGKDDDVDLLPSPWLRELGPTVSAASDSPSFAHRILAAKPILEVHAETSAPAFRLPHARGGTRIFELQSQCPFRAFAELRLQAEPLKATVPNIDARDRGILIHAAMAHLWQELRGSEGLQSTETERLSSLVRTTVARHAAPLLEGASLHRVRMLQIEQELAIERVLALLTIDRARAPFAVAGRPESKENVSIGALSFELRLDRVDELLAGPYRGHKVIVDYKTGSRISTAGWFRERPEQPQLPLYAVTHPDALAAVVFATLSAHDIAYRGVAVDSDILPSVDKFSEKDLPPPYHEWTGVLEFWRSVIGRLADQFLAGDARVDPLPTACRYCHLSTFCRIHEQNLLVDEEQG
jgi:ATP-dependent helicase/nuclease subunit B